MREVVFESRLKDRQSSHFFFFLSLASFHFNSPLLVFVFFCKAFEREFQHLLLVCKIYMATRGCEKEKKIVLSEVYWTELPFAWIKQNSGTTISSGYAVTLVMQIGGKM